MSLTQLHLTNFTAFKDLSLTFDKGINVFVGENATGKTHLLKLLYAACEVTTSGKPFPEKLQNVFQPHPLRMGRLVHRTKGSTTARVSVHRASRRLVATFSNHVWAPTSVKVPIRRDWYGEPIKAVYIPVKEMLAHAPGFRSLYSSREIYFDETYYDLLDKAYLPKLRGPNGAQRNKLLRALESAIQGRVNIKGEFFYLRNSQGELEFSLLAEGIRKLALLWLLIQNGTLLSGTVLFWDEPEANLNPRIIKSIATILLQLERSGVQIFLATHNYFVLKELDIKRDKHNSITYHSLFRNSDGFIESKSSGDYISLEPNAISDTFEEIYDAEIERALK